MDIRYGSNYKDAKGNTYRLVGSAVGMNKKDADILLFAPINKGTVGDVMYVSRKEANFEPVSKYF